MNTVWNFRYVRNDDTTIVVAYRPGQNPFHVNLTHGTIEQAMDFVSRHGTRDFTVGTVESFKGEPMSDDDAEQARIRGLENFARVLRREPSLSAVCSPRALRSVRSAGLF